jgi:hypothetical protein
MRRRLSPAPLSRQTLVMSRISATRYASPFPISVSDIHYTRLSSQKIYLENDFQNHI